MSHPQHLGRYIIEAIIAEGSDITLYKAYDPKFERFVTIKTISLKKLNSPAKKQLVAKLIWEFKTTIDLHHPNIVKYIELVNNDSMALIVMEHLAGKTLKSWIEDKHHFSIQEGVDILKQLLSALEHIHKNGITHRDIKPENIFLFTDGLIKIIDFGISYPIGKSKSQIEHVQGTPAYMAPEQIISSQNSLHTDLFSAGVILYELLCEQKPFRGEEQKSIIKQILTKEPDKPSSINTKIPKALDTIILKALAKRPSERFQSAKEFKVSLDAAIN
ncbi:MAG: serine/threonine protein kinase [Magnetococcales bacterium]|nr:serine/threonine protein kinase [Magnetococcales bacterium]